MLLKRNALRLCGLILFALLATTGVVQATTPEIGMLLVAGKQIKDPRFRGGVILLIQHGTRGSVGLMISRESRLSLTSIMPEDSLLAGDGATLSYGGPVEPKTLLALVKVRNYPPEPADEVVEGLYVTGVGVLEQWPDFAAEVVDYRVFVGYTGWAAGQLAHEIKRGDWHLLPADAERVWSGEGASLWAALQEMLAQ